ncbi:glycoside hydrolase [Streptomyces sp. NPDC055243]|uniref:glycoside hydrolase n=1 Tax=Streptomyces sp. NPDC055243 TaxID=3365720 RepID=UPI0037D1911D
MDQSKNAPQGKSDGGHGEPDRGRHRDAAVVGRRRRRRCLGMAVALVVTGTTASAGYAVVVAADDKSAQARPPEVHGGAVDFEVAGGTTTVDTGTLRVTGRAAGGALVPVSAAAADDLGRPGRVRVEGPRARWSYPAKGLQVTAVSEAGRLRMTVRAEKDGTLAWPVTGDVNGKGRGAEAANASLQIPRGEGLSVPATDRFWNSKAAGLAGTEAELATGSLTLPLWGYSAGGHGVSYLVPESIGSSLAFASTGGRLSATAKHAFSRREKTLGYTVTFALTSGSPIAPGRDYHRWLRQHGELRTLKRKITENPEIKKLLGAQHAYLWGGARGTKAVERLRKLGNTRLWLGYDADGSPMSEEAVAQAERQGYLVGPYDTYANGQDPESADTPVSKWPDKVYPDFCVRDWKGEIKTGFGGRGCYLSSEAFAKSAAAHPYLARHVEEMTENGVNSVFLDVDAAGELFADFSENHPMTKKQDRANRMERMRTLADEDGFVLGSESAVSWSAPALAFSHGSQTPVNDTLWPYQKEKEWGAYYPDDAPGFFFKPTTLPASLAKSMYDPAYRVPLYQTALHDSLISTDRWEMPYNKFPAQKKDRALMSVLYNTPLNFVLGEKNLEATGKEMAVLQRYFAPLHKAAGTERMTDFRRLTKDHMVQRSVFGDGALTVTANFGTKRHGSLPAGCVDAELKADPQPRRLCPADG